MAQTGRSMTKSFAKSVRDIKALVRYLTSKGKLEASDEALIKALAQLAVCLGEVEQALKAANKEKAI